MLSPRPILGARVLPALLGSAAFVCGVGSVLVQAVAAWQAFAPPLGAGSFDGVVPWLVLGPCLLLPWLLD